MKVKLIKQFLRFGIIGTLVFGFEAGILYGLTHYLPWSIYYCRLLSFIPAVILAWWLNRRFTFISIKGMRWWRELLRYCAVNALGSLVNLGAFFLVLHFVALIKPFPIAALAIGSVAGMFFNFISSKIWVFYR
ncbi:MAG: GtrA family protein [Methylococcales bacterium]